jgi:hypothetical protein
LWSKSGAQKAIGNLAKQAESEQSKRDLCKWGGELDGQGFWDFERGRSVEEVPAGFLSTAVTVCGIIIYYKLYIFRSFSYHIYSTSQ